MRLRATVLAIAALTILAFVETSLAMDADEIISRHLEAKGGVEKLRALKTLQMKGQFMSGSMVGEIQMAKRAPASYFFMAKTPRGISTQGCDGEHMWSTNPNTGFHKHEGDDFKKRLDQIVIEPLLGYKERGGRFEYIGTGDVRGDSCYKLLYIDAMGDTAYTAFFDVHNYHMLKVETSTPQGITEQFFEDLRDVDGYLFPFKLKMSSGDRKQTIAYDEITVNKPVPDSVFIMPDASTVPSVAKPMPDSLRDIPPERD